jgi:hypothetical protein
VATAWELRQQQKAQEAKKRGQIKAVTGTVAQAGVKYSLKAAVQAGGPAAASAKNIGTAGVWATVINLVGGLGIGAWQYLSGKKRTKKKERLNRKQAASIKGIDGFLTEINEVARVVIQEHGIDPTTPEFEKILYDNLFKTIGYRGNCNMTAWMPGTEGENRPVWFYVKQNGRVFQNVSMQGVPPNISTYWHTNCKNLKDGWANIYQDLLIQQGRMQDLEAFQQTRKQGVKILRIGFGIGFAILIFFVVKYGLTIK